MEEEQEKCTTCKRIVHVAYIAAEDAKGHNICITCFLCQITQFASNNGYVPKRFDKKTFKINYSANTIGKDLSGGWGEIV
jgi:hypothetical protein